MSTREKNYWIRLLKATAAHLSLHTVHRNKTNRYFHPLGIACSQERHFIDLLVGLDMTDFDLPVSTREFHFNIIDHIAGKGRSP